jgi:hypothetical protein
LRGKRFVKQVVLEESKAYLDSDVSYEKALQRRGPPLLYDDRDESVARAGGKEAPGLAPSTVWRWLSWLGSLSGVLGEASELIRQKHPGSALHRESWALPPTKYRSQERRRVLQRGMKLIATDRLFQNLFGKEIFPHFAMAQGWR